VSRYARNNPVVVSTLQEQCCRTSAGSGAAWNRILFIFFSRSLKSLCLNLDLTEIKKTLKKPLTKYLFIVITFAKISISALLSSIDHVELFKSRRRSRILCFSQIRTFTKLIKIIAALQHCCRNSSILRKSLYCFSNFTRGSSYLYFRIPFFINVLKINIFPKVIAVYK
jgi:hypothetical protein